METNPYQAPRSQVAMSAEGYGAINVLSASGRLNRLRYLAYAFGLGLVINLITGALMAAVGTATGNLEGGAALIIQLLGSLVAFVIVVMLAIQRLHDFGSSGWWSLLMIVPLVDLVLGLVLLFKSGSEGVNRFGPPPPPNTNGVKIMAGVVIGFFVLLFGGMLLALLLGGMGAWQQGSF